MRTAFLILSLLVWLCTTAQHLPPPSNELQYTNHTQYKLSERRALYPFKEAAAIMLVSFGPVDLKSHEDRDMFKLPMENDTVCFSRLNQQLILSQPQVDTLTDILYNTCYRVNINSVTRMACYIPRNAILFIDSGGRMMEYVEICLECRGKEESKEGLLKEEFCDNTYKLLQKYFIRLGLYTSIKQ
jgi:hypothetical protein